MQFWRKFWGRVTTGRWKVVSSATGKVIASYWTRKAAQDHCSEINDALQFIGSKTTYAVRWM